MQSLLGICPPFCLLIGLPGGKAKSKNGGPRLCSKNGHGRRIKLRFLSPATMGHLFNYWGKDGSFQTKSFKHTYTEKKYSCVRVLVLHFNPQQEKYDATMSLF